MNHTLIMDFFLSKMPLCCSVAFYFPLNEHRQGFFKNPKS